MNELSTARASGDSHGESAPEHSSVELSAQDAAWFEVVRKMDEVYADLVNHQVELEEKNTELQDSQEFIASVLASITDVIIVCDAKGVILQANRALERLIGEPEQKLKGRDFASLLAPESRAMAEGFSDKLRDSAVHDCEVNLTAAEGGAVPLAMNCTARFDHRGRLLGTVMVGRPVGELRQAYEELRHAHQELQQTQEQLVHAEKMASLGRLVAGVAHELNNPISFVTGNIHALQRYFAKIERYLNHLHGCAEVAEGAALREDLKVDKMLSDLDPLMEGTLEGTTRVSDIVQALKRFSSHREGRHVRFDLAAAVRTATNWVIKAERQPVDLQLALKEGVEAWGDEGQIQQVLVNLVQNALDAVAGRAHPRVEIALNCDSRQARVMVRDNGPGIDADQLNRVFDPFFTTKPVGSGTGLGLYISYGIMARHGGSLRAGNRAGGGAELVMELPLRAAHEHD